jgi:hypothetical protein
MVHDATAAARKDTAAVDTFPFCSDDRRFAILGDER